MKRILLFAIIPAFLLMISCAPILTGNGKNVPNDEEQTGHGFPTLRDRDGEPYFFYGGSPPRPFHGHDNDRQPVEVQVNEVRH